MEHYGASDRPPLQRCLDDIRGCDAYVGVFGWRYGFEPPEGEGASITSLEFEEATNQGLIRLVFLTPERDGHARHCQGKFQALE